MDPANAGHMPQNTYIASTDMKKEDELELIGKNIIKLSVAV